MVLSEAQLHVGAWLRALLRDLQHSHSPTFTVVQCVGVCVSVPQDARATGRAEDVALTNTQTRKIRTIHNSISFPQQMKTEFNKLLMATPKHSAAL